MHIKACEKELTKIYTSGKSKKYPKNIIDKFVKLINQIEAAETIIDLKEPPSNHLEKLEGIKKNIHKYSLRINLQMRLIFEVEFYDEEKLKGDVLILEISKHYE